MFWTVLPTPVTITPSVIVRRFAVRLSRDAGEAPKTAGIFSTECSRAIAKSYGFQSQVANVVLKNTSRTCDIKQLSEELGDDLVFLVKRNDVIMTSLLGSSDCFTVRAADRADSVELNQFLSHFKNQWEHAKPMNSDQFNCILSSKFEKMFKVIVIKREHETETERENGDTVGVLIIRILAVSSERGIRKTALLSHIAWDTAQPTLIPLLLNTLIRVSRDWGCLALLVNECCGIGDMLSGDERFVDMRGVGVENRLFFRDQGVVVRGVSTDQLGITLFE
jgi:hypothetical protein